MRPSIKQRMQIKVKPPSLEHTSIIAQAMSLQESGILLHGMEVTDLSTGYCTTGSAEMQQPGYLTFTRGDNSLADAVREDAGASQYSAVDYPYRATGLSMRRLEKLLVLVKDVAAQREANKEWASVNPPAPRNAFPWGLGLDKPDILVTKDTEAAEGIIAFLRQRGFRARKVDPSEACEILADLREIELEREHGREEEEYQEPDQEESGAWGDYVGSRVSKKFVLAAAAIALVSLAGLAAIYLPGSTREVTASEAASDSSAGRSGTSTSSAAPSAAAQQQAATQGNGKGKEQHPPSAEKRAFEEHRKSGDNAPAPAAERAAIPVAIDVAGWRRVGATQGREEFMSDDPDMRILVAAAPAPVESQEQLDQAVLTAIEKARRDTGKSDLEVVGVSPAAYKEMHPTSHTQWTVRLVDGHQMSVGCQIRDTGDVPPRVADARGKACQQAIDTARLERLDRAGT
ncbi:type VII secretion-associated protein [Corynebacterium sp. zg254]|uniref:Type VII secretion-associated protein n=1 Tax=Corynebacterium zhongnanshanii TaxID=2768834 RepID=A0ABQ6VEY9_9CORY|nr:MULTISPECIES: type VII secretion-associated protein [Corynebacterium]KAB3522883.1 type VII secretion-associated protein [Corynebacterium zhongnanshanii]MCR5914046.1 type VII secretion-associated protein [Corynebacterium sp. zg254]